MNPRHFLEVDDLTPAEFAEVLDNAARWKHLESPVPQHLEGRGVAILFEKPSARTRVSTEMAVFSMGGHPMYIRPEEVGLGVRESVADVARTMNALCGAIAARVFDHATLEEMASVVEIPVVNLLSDRAHPCQAVADFLTLRELVGDLEGRRLVYVGDGNNVAASLAYAAALSGVELTVASPVGYELDDVTVDRARNLGGVIELALDPYEAVRGADAVYTDVWTSMGQEEETAIRRAAFEGYQVNAELMNAAGEQAWFLHCLPAHRGEEVTDDVIDGPRSAVWQQAGNRMDAARAVLAFLVGDVAEARADARVAGAKSTKRVGDVAEARADARVAGAKSTKRVGEE